MTETIDAETGEIVTQASVPAARHVSMPTPYSSAETGQIAEAMAAAQGEMESPKRTKPGKIEGVSKATGKPYSYGYMYAPFEELVRVIKAVFPKHGLMYHQGLVTRGEQFFIRTHVRHVSGEWIASDYPVFADKATPLGFAGGTTYAKRYGLSLVGGIAAEDDNDGAAAQEAAPDLKPSVKAVRVNDNDTQLAREALLRIRREIADAIDTDELDRIYAVAATRDKDLIERQRGGKQAWDNLVDRDQKRRNELAHPSPPGTDEDPPLVEGTAFERDYRI